MRKILLVNPHETQQLGYSNPPLGLLYLAGTALKAGFDVRVVDGCLEGKEAVQGTIREFRPNIVGITCMTPGRKRALEVARTAKEFDPEIDVVLGGPHATIMHEQLLTAYPYVDHIVLGEGENTLVALAGGTNPREIRGLAFRESSGAVVRNPPRENVGNLDDIPFPAWDLVDLKRYPARDDCGFKIVNGVRLDKEPRISVIFSRGCVGHCTFCSTWWIWKGWRHRTAANMADELELLVNRHGVRHICFADDAMTVDRGAAMELCDEILERKLRLAFSCTTRSDCVDEALLAKMKAAGCYSIAYGIESGSAAILKKMNKANDIGSAERAIEMTKKAGIFVSALLIVGNVGETDDTVKETVRFIKRTRPNSIGIAGSLWIFPGTRLYQDCKRARFIDDGFWLSDEPYKVYTLEHDLATLRRYSLRLMWHGVGPWKMVRDKVRDIAGRVRLGGRGARPA